MWKANKKQLIFASALTLLPVVLGLILRYAAPALWYIGLGTTAPLPTMMLWMPLMLTGLLWVVAWATSMDNQGKNKKVSALVLWTIPVISNLCIAVTYCAMLYEDFSVGAVMIIILGLLFTVIGNYLPKCRQNRTIGIRTIWTLASTENWNATHRFGGPVWVLGGIVMMLCACLPRNIGMPLFVADMFLFILAPVLYSYLYYKKQCKSGNAPDLKQVKNQLSKWHLLAIAAVLIFVCVIMFTGNIDFTFQEDHFTIDSTYDHNMVVYYDTIESVEWREQDDWGYRAAGFGSAKLLLGLFENDEFGRYSRYSYTACHSAVVIRLNNGAALVLNGNNDAETRALYEALLERVSQ